MFSERLRHCQAATRNYVADAFFLVDKTPYQSRWYLSLQGKVSTVLSKLPDRGHRVESVEVSMVSHGDSNLMLKTSDPRHI